MDRSEKNTNSVQCTGYTFRIFDEKILADFSVKSQMLYKMSSF